MKTIEFTGSAPWGTAVSSAGSILHHSCDQAEIRSTAETTRPLALVTGASTGIGYELAKTCAENGFDLLATPETGEECLPPSRRRISRCYNNFGWPG